MQNCQHNVYDSLHKRYLKETPELQHLDMRLVHRIIDNLVHRLKTHMTDFDASNFLSSKTGKLRARYLKAYNDISRRGFDINRDSDISAFVKLERYYEAGKAPRMIMGRNPKFNWFYAQIIDPIERAFFALDQVANACDNFSCGEKFSRMVGEWFIENDMSKFEASQRKQVLHFEYLVYSKLFPHRKEFLDLLFAAKMHKRGGTSSGVKFAFDYCRGSGDMDTSLGNGILNYIATQYFLIKNFCPNCDFEQCAVPGCRTFSFVVKGDDSYMRAPKYCTPTNYYANFGFDAKLIVRKAPHEVEFCSGHFVEYQPGKYVYAQKLRKILASLTTCINEEAVRNGWVAHYYKSLGLMYNKLYSGIPIYQDIGKMLMTSNVNAGLNVNLIQSYNLLHLFKNIEPQDRIVDFNCAYASIMMVNNMDPAELEAIGETLRNSYMSFEPALTKKCRIRSRKAEEVPPVDWDTLNTKIIRSHVKDRSIIMHLKQLPRN